MATRYVQQAAKKLDPLFDQQVRTVRDMQLPAVTRLYDALIQGLAGEQQAGMQNVLEDVSSRGFLRSTLPVEGQAAVGAQALAKAGQLEAERMQEVGALRQQMSDIRARQAGAIADLATKSQQGDITAQQFDLTKRKTQLEIEQQRQQHELRMRQLNQQLSRGY